MRKEYLLVLDWTPLVTNDIHVFSSLITIISSVINIRYCVSWKSRTGISWVRGTTRYRDVDPHRTSSTPLSSASVSMLALFFTFTSDQPKTGHNLHLRVVIRKGELGVLGAIYEILNQESE